MKRKMIALALLLCLLMAGCKPADPPLSDYQPDDTNTVVYL